MILHDVYCHECRVHARNIFVEGPVFREWQGNLLLAMLIILLCTRKHSTVKILSLREKTNDFVRRLARIPSAESSQ